MKMKRFWQALILTSFVVVGFINTAQAKVLSNAQAQQALDQAGFHPWQWQTSSCQDCELYVLPVNPQIQTEKVQLFVQSLGAHKAELLALYHSDGREYNLLAHMAVGILGRESEFFTSTRYNVKENFPNTVALLKIIQIYLDGGDRDPSPNSRGPTQIKVVPAKVAEAYGITSDQLYIPEKAAIATMGYLIEALRELKNRAKNNHLEFINENTYVDYLPYLYFGRARALVDRTATPERNLYVQTMKKYMTWVELYERVPSERLH